VRARRVYKIPLPSGSASGHALSSRGFPDVVPPAAPVAAHRTVRRRAGLVLVSSSSVASSLFWRCAASQTRDPKSRDSRSPHVRMIQRREDPRLPLEASQTLGIATDERRQHLESDARPSLVSCARNTSPIPPEPSFTW
jgi:hypothetical protein